MFLGIDLALWHESIHAVGPGISTLLNSLQIFFLAGIGFAVFGERQSKRQLVSLLLAIVGVAMIASPEFAHNAKAGWGFMSGIVSGAMLALSMSCVRQSGEVLKHHRLPDGSTAKPFATSMLMLLVSIGGCLALLPLMLWLDAGRILPPTLQAVGWILVYGAVMQCMAWGMIAHAIPKVSLAVTGLLLLSEPVAALVIDFVWLDKPITLMQWLGAGVTMLAIYLGSLVKKTV